MHGYVGESGAYSGCEEYRFLYCFHGSIHHPCKWIKKGNTATNAPQMLNLELSETLLTAPHRYTEPPYVWHRASSFPFHTPICPDVYLFAHVTRHHTFILCQTEMIKKRSGTCFIAPSLGHVKLRVHPTVSTANHAKVADSMRDMMYTVYLYVYMNPFISLVCFS